MTQPFHSQENLLIPPIRLVELETEPSPPATIVPSPIDLRQIRVDEFLQSRRLAQNTQRSYRLQLSQFMTWTDKAWQDISHRDILRYKLQLERDHLAPASVGAALIALKSFFRWLCKLGYVAENPTTGIEIPKNPQDTSKALSDRQVQALYQALSQRYRTRLRDTAVLAVLSHGLRASEVSGLDVGDYDGTRLHIREAKDESTGTVPLDADARAAIETYLDWREAQGETLNPNVPMFLSDSYSAKFRGDRLSYRSIYNLVKALGQSAQTILVEQGRSLEAAQLKAVHPHQLRHTYASNLVLDGMDAYLAMALTRHRSIAVFQRYSQQARSRQAEIEFFKLKGEDSALNSTD